MMNKTIVVVLWLLCGFSTYLNAQCLSNDANYYDADTGNVEERYAFYYLHRYLQKSEIERIDYFAQLLRNPPVIHFFVGIKDTVILNNFIDDLLGIILQEDIESRANVSFNNAIVSSYPGFYCTDFALLDSLLKQSASVIRKGSCKKKKEFIDRAKYLTYDYYPSYLFPYFQNSVRNRIRFIEEFHFSMDSVLLQIVKLDIDTLLHIDSPISIDNKHPDSSVLFTIDLWKEKLNASHFAY